MSSINVTLPDGSTQQVAEGITPLEIAKSISPRLADDAVVARVNGDLYDLTRPLESDASLQILTSKNPEALEVYRHSTAHLLALAVLELFPETKLGIGPPTEAGFYYDFQRDTPFTPEDLEKIEAKMVGDPEARSAVRTQAVAEERRPREVQGDGRVNEV